MDCWWINYYDDRTMNGMKFNLSIIFAIVLQFVGLVWYLSKVDSRVNLLYDNFEAENQKSVIENQVKMKLDLENIIQDVKELRKVVKKLKSKDQILINQNEVITEDHQRLFEILENSSSNSSGYSYGD